MPRDEKERVLAVEAAGLFARGRFQGCLPGASPYLHYLFEPRHGRYLERALAEDDPAWKQVIPYVLLAHAGRLLSYQRGQASGEARLRALVSIGWGGHIRPEDASLFAPAGRESYLRAMERELAEELSWPAGARRSDRIVGLINDDSLPVGRVHIGVVHIWEMSSGEVEKRERKIVSPRWLSPEELLAAEMFERLETWSQLCLRHWPELQAQPGWSPSAACD